MPRLDALPDRLPVSIPAAPAPSAAASSEQPDLHAGRRHQRRLLAACQAARMTEPVMLEAVRGLAFLRCFPAVAATALGAGAEAHGCERWMTFRSTSRAGATFALVGESGCGKSTIARLAVGLYSPATGTSCSRTRRCPHARAQPALRRRMNMIFQDPYASLNPRWRVRDIVAEPIRVFRSRDPSERGRRPGRSRCSPRSA